MEFLAIILSVISSIFYGLYTILNKIALTDYEKNDHKFINFILMHKHSMKELLLSRTFLLALLCGLLSFFLLAKAQAYGDLSLVYPISNLSFVFSVVFGYFILKEKLNREETMCLLLVFVGIFIVVLSKPIESPMIISKDNLFLFSVGIAIFMGLSTLYTHKYPSYISGEIFAINSGLCLGNGYLFMKNFSINLDNANRPAMMEVLSSFEIIAPFIIFGLLAAFSFVFLQFALARGKVSIIAPITIVLSTTVPFVGGYYVYNEFISAEKIFGVILIIFGIILLSLFNEND